MKSEWKKQLVLAGLVAVPTLVHAAEMTDTGPPGLKAATVVVPASMTAIPVNASGQYTLSDFGDVSKGKELQQLVDQACAAIVAKGGGTLIIPPTAFSDVLIENHSQTKRENGYDVTPVVTIIDRRGGYENILVPTIGKWSPGAWTGHTTRRSYNFKGPGASSWGIATATGIENRVIHGTSSYLHPTISGAPQGKDSKIYVTTVRGLFVGQYLNYYIGPVYDGGYEPITVKSIGWDKDKNQHYITADLEKEHFNTGFLSNKNMVGGMAFDSSLNSDQQTGGELGIVRKQYANGDSFLISAVYAYQGDQITQMGDEGGVLYNAEVAQDADPFHSVVESVDWSQDKLVFAPGDVNVDKVASSRHLINMNEKKWVTAGSVKIVGTDNWSGMLINDPSVNVDAVIKDGLPMKDFKFTRTAKPGEDLSIYGWGGSLVSRDMASGKSLVPTIKTWQGVPVKKLKHIYQGRSYPTLQKGGYNWMGGRIIASKDSGWTKDIVGRYFAVADESEYLYVGDKKQGASYMAGEVARKTYRWYPIRSFWTNPDGTFGIRLGRERMYASGAGAPQLYNEDNYTWDGHERPMQYIIAPGAMTYDVGEGYKDAYAGRSIASDPRTIRITDGSYRNTAFDFAPGDKIEQSVGADPVLPTPFRVRLHNNIPDNFGRDGTGAYSVVNFGRVSAASAFQVGSSITNYNDFNLRKDHKPPFLKGLDLQTATEDGILFGGDTSNAALNFTQPNGHAQPIKWTHDKGITSLVVNPLSGDMAISGSVLAVPAIKQTRGISATAISANNLRGINSLVPSGRKSISVRFAKPEPDSEYSINVQPSWLTQDAVTQKTAAGFTVVFSNASGAGARLDWQLIR